MVKENKQPAFLYFVLHSSLSQEYNINLFILISIF